MTEELDKKVADLKEQLDPVAWMRLLKDIQAEAKKEVLDSIIGEYKAPDDSRLMDYHVRHYFDPALQKDSLQVTFKLNGKVYNEVVELPRGREVDRHAVAEIVYRRVANAVALAFLDDRTLAPALQTWLKS